MKYGYIRLAACFSREKAAEWSKDVWVRLGYSPTDKSTWTQERVNMPSHKEEPVQTFAPKAWAAICELLGGEDRIIAESATWNDGLIVNFGKAENEGHSPDPRELKHWHVDGAFFMHYRINWHIRPPFVARASVLTCPRGGRMSKGVVYTEFRYSYLVIIRSQLNASIPTSFKHATSKFLLRVL